ncbi:RsfS/YbeB/iojap family protein, partial [Rhizobium ruizarguesonis]
RGRTSAVPPQRDLFAFILSRSCDIIVHVFSTEIREFYNIEKMWAATDMDEETRH